MSLYEIFLKINLVALLIFSKSLKIYLFPLILLIKMEKENMSINRVVLYSKDICTITGRKYRYARKLYRSIQQFFNKQPEQFITLEEFCSFTGIRAELVKHFLKY